MLELLKKWWWVIATGILGMFAVLYEILRAKTPPPPAIDTEKKQAEDVEQKAVDAAVVEKDKEEADAQATHDADEKALITAEEKAAEKLKDDPDATNDFLKQVGKETRGE